MGCLSVVTTVTCMSLLLLLAPLPCPVVGQLQVGFYNSSCPSAESLVQQAVASAFANNSGVAAGIVRLHFHDCFVRGCDGSVLLNSTGNSTAERDAVPPNNPSLHGFEVINAAKSAVEAQCPQTVSCADILAFAARDSIALTGNFTYQVPSGRRDGNVSLASEANSNLPSPLFNATQLIGNFANKGLSPVEMVILSGAHTIGVSHCLPFLNRINTSQVDPTLSPAYAVLLQNLCPQNSSQFTPITTALDLSTPTVFDNNYYKELQLGLGLLTSDQALLTNATLSAAVTEFAANQTDWQQQFIAAFLKMGQIEVLTGTQGEVRLNCNFVNNANSSTNSSATGLAWGTSSGREQDNVGSLASY